MKETPPYWNGCCSWCKKACTPVIVIHAAVYCSTACENEADDPPPQMLAHHASRSGRKTSS